MILKDYIQEDGWEPALSIGPQVLGWLPHRSGLTALDQCPPYCSAYSEQLLLRPQPSLTFTHWIGHVWNQGSPTQSRWQLSLRSGQTWPRMLGQLGNPNELCQMWDIAHQPLILVTPSYHLKFGERSCGVVGDNLIYTWCPGIIINRTSIHSQKYCPLQGARPHSPSLIVHPLAFMCFIPFLVGISSTMTLPNLYIRPLFLLAHSFLCPLHSCHYKTTLLHSQPLEDVSQVPELAAFLTYMLLQSLCWELLSSASGMRTRCPLW